MDHSDTSHGSRILRGVQAVCEMRAVQESKDSSGVVIVLVKENQDASPCHCDQSQVLVVWPPRTHWWPSSWRVL